MEKHIKASLVLQNLSNNKDTQNKNTLVPHELKLSAKKLEKMLTDPKNIAKPIIFIEAE